MNPQYPKVAKRADHRCEYCRAPESIFNFPFEVEHVIPISKGGTNNSENLALSCRSCNLRKSNFTTAIDPQSGTEVRLFNPRNDQWSEHMEANLDLGIITGKTDIGRGAVQRLKMNGEPQVQARKLWTQLNLFP
ncbi:MAG: HNH endonuclease signature motif containing protein [Cyanobacteria bacterium P01_C01_bin.89]